MAPRTLWQSQLGTASALASQDPADTTGAAAPHVQGALPAWLPAPAPYAVTRIPDAECPFSTLGAHFRRWKALGGLPTIETPSLLREEQIQLSQPVHTGELLPLATWWPLQQHFCVLMVGTSAL